MIELFNFLVIIDFINTMALSMKYMHFFFQIQNLNFINHF